MSRILPIFTLFAAVAASWFFVTTGVAKPEHLVTLLGIASGAAVVAYQLGEQQRASLTLQRENARQALKLRVYDDLLEKVSVAVDATVKCSWYIRSIEASIQLYVQGVSWNNDATIKGLMKRSSQASKARTDLIGQLERWEVSLATADLFRIAFCVAEQDVSNTHSEFFKEAISLLPSNKGSPPKFMSLSREKFDVILARTKEHLDAVDILNTYFHDLVVEAQNELVGALFQRRVARRKPLDPRYKVISEEARDSLQRYFAESTRPGHSPEGAREGSDKPAK